MPKGHRPIREHFLVVAFHRICGLEFARARLVQAPGLRNLEEIAFGIGRSGQCCLFLLGFSIGISLGLLFAPRSGKETRRELRARAEELERRAIETGREKAGQLGRTAGERLFDKAVGEER